MWGVTHGDQKGKGCRLGQAFPLDVILHTLTALQEDVQRNNLTRKFYPLKK
ncbi:hypothetical protein ACZ87_02915 [Candidatus Erwinia dacicola]|uniref:Uncharacterized protein n=1 Tax=Candidatus Erwinia dacicola TaxID=252393 RepID=A0A328TJL7_9GAMM|nr:hypothetical protein ACZ87_02915 [Candidatus Erwinia dacicola]